jgi:hypothetical protein
LLILLVLQNGALFLICMWLRWLQFSLGRHAVRRGEPERIEDFNALRDLRENQFQMRDVLVWTTVLAIALGAARALDYWSSSVAAFEQAKAGIARYGWSIAAMPTPTAAICTAMILLIAIWSALGAGCAMWRWSILLTVVCAVTMAHGLFDFFQKTRVWGWTPLWRGWEVFFDFQQPLMIWDGLAGGMLFAALLMFRALGYRLVRSRGIAVEENKVAAELQG